MITVVHQTTPAETKDNKEMCSELNLHRRMSELIILCGGGDRDAFRELYELTSKRVFGILVAVLRDRLAAEEVAQEVYVQIWRQAETYKKELGSPLGWIATIARSRGIDRLRADRARGFVQFSDDVPDIADEKNISSPSEEMLLTRALSELRPEYRKVILLSYFRGYTHVELAEILDLPIGTVKSWMKRGLAELRKAMS